PTPPPFPYTTLFRSIVPSLNSSSFRSFPPEAGVAAPLFSLCVNPRAIGPPWRRRYGTASARHPPLVPSTDSTRPTSPDTPAQTTDRKSTRLNSSHVK